MWVSNGSSVVGDNVWDLVLTDGLSDDLGELERGFLGIESMWLHSSLGVVKDSEVLVGLVDGDGALNVFDVVWHDGGVFDGVDGWDGAITF